MKIAIYISKLLPIQIVYTDRDMAAKAVKSY
jgi:hypothetical protein